MDAEVGFSLTYLVLKSENLWNLNSQSTDEYHYTEVARHRKRDFLWPHSSDSAGNTNSTVSRSAAIMHAYTQSLILEFCRSEL